MFPFSILTFLKVINTSVGSSSLYCSIIVILISLCLDFHRSCWGHFIRYFWSSLFISSTLQLEWFRRIQYSIWWCFMMPLSISTQFVNCNHISVGGGKWGWNVLVGFSKMIQQPCPRIKDNKKSDFDWSKMYVLLLIEIYSQTIKFTFFKEGSSVSIHKLYSLQTV